MNGNVIPDQDNITRYCKSSTVEENGEILASAFVLKQTDSFLSVNWLEFLNLSTRDDEVAEIKRVYSRTFRRIGARSKIAVLNVGEVCEKVFTESEDRRNLEVLHNPSEIDPSHSGIFNLRHNDMLIAELILETVRESHSARV